MTEVKGSKIVDVLAAASGGIVFSLRQGYEISQEVFVTLTREQASLYMPRKCGGDWVKEESAWKFTKEDARRFYRRLQNQGVNFTGEVPRVKTKENSRKLEKSAPVAKGITVPQEQPKPETVVAQTSLEFLKTIYQMLREYKVIQVMGMLRQVIDAAEKPKN